MSDPRGVAYNERVLCLGPTGSGKSELLNHLFTNVRVQRLLHDTKHEWRVDGVEAAHSVEEIDWTQTVVHYRCDGSLASIERLYAECFRRRHLVVACHELGDLCEFRPNATPTSVRSLLNKGRVHGLGLLGASQRPVMMPTHARTEVQHVFLFVRARLYPDDHKTVAQIVGIPPDDLAREADRVRDELGEYAFLWWNMVDRELIPCPPLPDRLRDRSIVHRDTVA